MHICVISDNSVGPCAYVRLVAPNYYHAISFKAIDIIVTFHYDPDADVYVFQRPYKWARPLLQDCYGKGKTILFEYDDPLWNVAVDRSEGRETFVGNDYKAVTKSIVKYADGIVVSTDNLGKNFCENITDKKPIIVMPNAVAPIVTPTEHNKVIFYGGCGHSAKIKHWNDNWFEAMDTMRKKGYTIHSSVDIPVEHTEFKATSWPCYLNSVAKLRPEYYIAPLADNEESRCKSNLKELEAWQLGAKFIGQGAPYSNSIPYDATTEDIIEAIKNAKVPTFDERYDMSSHKYAERWITVYSGNWLKQIGGI